jgi:hypothetical protein
MTSRGKRIALGLGVLIGILLIFAWRLYYHDRWAVERYKQHLLAAGEKLKIEEILPPLPMPQSNGAPIFSHAVGIWASNPGLLESNTPLAMHLIIPGKAMVGWQQPGVGEQGTNAWSQAEASLAQESATLDQVREAAARGVLDFQLDYRQGFSLLLPHLAPLRRSVQFLGIAAVCDLHRGDASAAAGEIETILDLVRAMGPERLPITQLVRISMTHLSVAPTWELLQYPDLTEDQLATLQSAWSELKFIQPAEDSLAMERAVSELLLERMRNSSAQFRQVLSLGPPAVASGFSIGQAGDNLVQDLRAARWRIAQSYPDQLRALKGDQVLLETLRAVRAGQPFATEFAAQEARLATLGLQSTNNDFNRDFDPSGSDVRWLFSQSVVSMSRLLNRVFTAEAARELAVTALALKRYHLVHHQYPAELPALVPQFLAGVPRDPADGQPLRYRLQPDGTFLLYSIGEDGMDNGGDSSSEGHSKSISWQRGRDLVWPRQATPEEIKTFWANGPKKLGGDRP